MLLTAVLVVASPAVYHADADDPPVVSHCSSPSSASVSLSHFAPAGFTDHAISAL